jgi:hypothetical protein
VENDDEKRRPTEKIAEPKFSSAFPVGVGEKPGPKRFQQ